MAPRCPPVGLVVNGTVSQTGLGCLSGLQSRPVVASVRVVVGSGAEICRQSCVAKGTRLMRCRASVDDQPERSYVTPTSGASALHRMAVSGDHLDIGPAAAAARPSAG